MRIPNYNTLEISGKASPLYACAECLSSMHKVNGSNPMKGNWNCSLSEMWNNLISAQLEFGVVIDYRITTTRKWDQNKIIQFVLFIFVWLFPIIHLHYIQENCVQACLPHVSKSYLDQCYEGVSKIFFNFHFQKAWQDNFCQTWYASAYFYLSQNYW